MLLLVHHRGGAQLLSQLRLREGGTRRCGGVWLLLKLLLKELLLCLWLLRRHLRDSRRRELQKVRDCRGKKTTSDTTGGKKGSAKERKKLRTDAEGCCCKDAALAAAAAVAAVGLA